MNIIEIKNLNKHFQNGGKVIKAVDDVSFSIEEGQFVSITGKSGSGKSTMLYQLGLLDHPTSGEVYIEGQRVDNIDADDRTYIRLTKLGYVFQDYAIIPSLTATENVMAPLVAQGMTYDEARELAHAALEEVGLGHRLDNLPSALSGGEQQRVAIARAISHKPKVLFADEPTANLDSETSAKVLEVFKNLNDNGQTIVMVTHEDEYAEMTDRIITLKDGQVIADSKKS